MAQDVASGSPSLVQSSALSPRPHQDKLDIQQTGIPLPTPKSDIWGRLSLFLLFAVVSISSGAYFSGLFDLSNPLPWEILELASKDNSVELVLYMASLCLNEFKHEASNFSSLTHG